MVAIDSLFGPGCVVLVVGQDCNSTCHVAHDKLTDIVRVPVYAVSRILHGDDDFLNWLWLFATNIVFEFLHIGSQIHQVHISSMS